MDLEEDTYNQIFKALKHPIRRRILKTLESNPHTYTYFLTSLDVETGLLNYHLENLGDLINKNGKGEYQLTEFGRAALNLIEQIEDPYPTHHGKTSFFQKKFVTKILSLCVIALLGASLYSWSLYQENTSWVSTNFTDNLVESESNFYKLIHELDNIISNGTVNDTDLDTLNQYVETVAVGFTKITYLDRNHGDMWDETGAVFLKLDTLIHEIREKKAAENLDEIVFSDDALQRLKSVHSDMEQLYKSLYPTDDLEEKNPWISENAAAVNQVLENIEQLDLSISKSWVISITLTETSTDLPEVKARGYLIDQLGETYFTDAFTLRSIQYREGDPEEWLVAVTYDYAIRIGNYTRVVDVTLYYDKSLQLIGTTGVPDSSSLMPFNVTLEEAVTVAKGTDVGSYVEMDANIHFADGSTDKIERASYYWEVIFYKVPKNSSSGSATSVFIDVHTGEIVNIFDFGWSSVS